MGALRNLAMIIQPDGGSYSFGYDNGGLLTNMKVPKANSEGLRPYVFRIRERELAKDTDPLGGTQSVKSTVTFDVIVDRVVQRSIPLGRKTKVFDEAVRAPAHALHAGARRIEAHVGKLLNGELKYRAPDGRYFDTTATGADGTRTFSTTQQHPVYGISSGYARDMLTILPSD